MPSVFRTNNIFDDFFGNLSYNMGICRLPKQKATFLHQSMMWME